MAADRRARVETLAWVCIYGGLLVAVLGLFATRQPDGGTLGVLLLAVGVAVALGGALLVWLRSRMDPPTGPRR